MMNMKDKLRLILVPIAVSGLFMFLACGHQSNLSSQSEEDLFAGLRKEGNGQSADESGAAEKPAAADKKKSLDEILSDAAKTAPPAEGADMKIALGDKNPADIAGSSGESIKNEDSLTTMSTTPNAENILPEQKTKEEVLAPEAPIRVLESPTTEAEKSPSPEATEETPRAPANEVTPVKESQVPSVGTEPISKGDLKLNRYYILRDGDSAKSVSELIYGNENREGDLMAWNSGAWKTGNLVYYASVDKPEDTSLFSFYEERNVPNQSYTVKEGDWLSTIADETYGDVRSWKEIAILNHIAAPDKIQPGLVLTLYPVKLEAYAAKKTQDVAAATMVPIPEKTDVAPELKPSMDSPFKMDTQEKVAAKDMKNEREAATLANPEVGSFFLDHILAIAALLGLVGFSIVFWAILSRDKKTPTDF